MYGIFPHIYSKNQPNVGKHTSPMDPLGDGFGMRTAGTADDPGKLAVGC